MKETGIQADGVYLNASEKFKRKPLPELSRCLKAEKNDAGVIIRSASGGGAL